MNHLFAFTRGALGNSIASLLQEKRYDKWRNKTTGLEISCFITIYLVSQFI